MSVPDTTVYTVVSGTDIGHELDNGAGGIAHALPCGARRADSMAPP